MSNYAIINLKTDPALKKAAAQTAKKLGISLSAVLNNELRRFSSEQSVVFDTPEVPNAKTAAEMAQSKQEITRGDYHTFSSKKQSLEFLAKQLK